MQKFERRKKYKAKEPEETIKQIQGILSDLGIKVENRERCFDPAGVYSGRIWLSDETLVFGDFGTNGKGMNGKYSMASEYAELMERLENLILFGDYPEDACRKGLTPFFAAPDEKMMTASECMEESGSVLEKLLRLNERPADGSDEKMPALPYMDLNGGKQIYLPVKTLRMAAGSNGMCAGNTYMEAVTQGLCEIYERAAVMEAYRDNREVCRLHPESFEGYDIHEKLEKMRREGYDYAILDLSMGKKYPVVALLLEKDGKKAFRAGADPCPVTALERCLTEIFQGEREEVSRFFKSECCPAFPSLSGYSRFTVNDEEIAYHVDGSGKAPECIFNPSDKYSEDFAGTCGISEKDDYDYMLALTRELGLGLYIRDCSFLGFPAYHVIVPELSNYDLVYEDGAEIYEWSFEKTQFRNDRFSKAVAEILNKLFDRYTKWKRDGLNM